MANASSRTAPTCECLSHLCHISYVGIGLVIGDQPLIASFPLLAKLVGVVGVGSDVQGILWGKGVCLDPLQDLQQEREGKWKGSTAK